MSNKNNNLIIGSIIVIGILLAMGKLNLFAIDGGPLHVQGNKIYNQLGQEFIPRGLTYIDQGHVDRRNKLDEDFRVAAQVWKANIMRMPVHPENFNGKEDYYFEQYLDPQINAAQLYGMYAVIDYHAYDELDLNALTQFWSKVAPRYATRNHVIYEIMNEPTKGDWNKWRDNAEVITDLIRQYDPNAVVIVNGLDWGYQVQYALAEPVNRENVIYGTHPYPNKLWVCGGANACTEQQKEAEWYSKFGIVAEQYPVIVSEFGWDYNSNAVWGYGTNENYGQPLLNYLDNIGVGYMAWSWSNAYGPTLLSNFDSYTPTQSGQTILNHLLLKNGLSQTTTTTSQQTTTTINGATTTTIGNDGSSTNIFGTILSMITSVLTYIVDIIAKILGGLGNG